MKTAASNGVDVAPGHKIWQASLKNTAAAAIMNKHTEGNMRGLFSKDPHARFVRARYPNFNPETAQVREALTLTLTLTLTLNLSLTLTLALTLTAQWGYSSPDRDKLSFNTEP